MASTSVTIKDFRRDIPGALDEAGSTWNFPVVSSVNSRGKTMTWKVFVQLVPANNTTTEDILLGIEDSFFDSSKQITGVVARIDVESSIEGGKVRKTVPTLVKAGKNIGRANATNIWTQALRDALGLHNKHAKKGTTAVSEVEMYPPMLASIYDSTFHVPTIQHPCCIQRKYNGVRMMAMLSPASDNSKRVVMYSRGRNIYPGLDYIREEVARVLEASPYKSLCLDGEVYKHGVPLQTIAGDARRGETSKTAAKAAKKLADNGSNSNQPTENRYFYMVYDCFDPTDTTLLYSRRSEILSEVLAINLTYIQQVETRECHSTFDVQSSYEEFLAEGFEGAILRTDSRYIFSYNGHRSFGLLKMKPSFDGEFELVGFGSGTKGKAAQSLMVDCKDDKGNVFTVTPALEIAAREALFLKMQTVESNGKSHFENHWRGKKIIVTYDELSKDGTPLRARTELVVRDWD